METMGYGLCGMNVVYHHANMNRALTLRDPTIETRLN